MSQEFSFPPGLRVACMAELGLSHVYVCENGQMYDTRKGCEIFPQKRFNRVELRSYDLDIERVRYSLDHILGYYFRAPWRAWYRNYYICRLDMLNARHYHATSDGRLFSTRTWDYVQGTLSHDGYLHVLLTRDDGTELSINLHRIIAICFLPNPENKNEVNHIDGNKLNNHVSNLEWTWSYENMQHARENGLRKMAITDEQIHQICALLERGHTNTEIANMLNIPTHHVKDIKAGCHMRISRLYNIPRTKHFNLKPSNNPTGAQRTRISTCADIP